MAHRLITTVVITGTRILKRAFKASYQQATAASQYQKWQAKNNTNGGTSSSLSSRDNITLEEACQILNCPPPKGGISNMEDVMERFKRQFDANDPKKGGSFYLQSKILRARERIEKEHMAAEEKAALELEAKEGWKPKPYRDR